MYTTQTLASSPLLYSPRFRPRSRSRPRPRPRPRIRYSPLFRPRSRVRSHLVFIHGSPPSFPFPLRPRSRPRSHLALVRSPAPPFSFPLRPGPHHRSRPRSRPLPSSRLRSHPRLRLRSRPDPFCSFPPTGPAYSLGTLRVYRYRALRTKLSGIHKNHPLSAVRSESACYKTIENRRRRRATIVPSARCWDSLECISNLCSTRLNASSLMKACTSETTASHVTYREEGGSR